MTELHELVCQNDYDRIEDELKKGKLDVNARDEEWGYRAAIHCAASRGYSECIKLLVQNGCMPYAKDYRGWSAAHFAAEAGKTATCRVLYTLGAPMDHADRWGFRPSDVARVYGHTECLKYLNQIEGELRTKREKQKTGRKSQSVDWDREDPADWRSFVNIEWGNPEFEGGGASGVYIPYLMTAGA